MALNISWASFGTPTPIFFEACCILRIDSIWLTSEKEERIKRKKMEGNENNEINRKGAATRMETKGNKGKRENMKQGNKERSNQRGDSGDGNNQGNKEKGINMKMDRERWNNGKVTRKGVTKGRQRG